MLTFYTCLEFLCCCAVLVFKIVTDIQIDQIQKSNEKQSSEWGLLKRLNYYNLSMVTYISFTLITILLLITRVFMRSYKREAFEEIVLILGAILFLFEGFSALITAEYTYENIQLNYLILGGLSLLVGIIFILDVCCFHRKQKQQKDNNTQTEYSNEVASVQKTVCCNPKLYRYIKHENYKQINDKKISIANKTGPNVIRTISRGQYLSTEL